MQGLVGMKRYDIAICECPLGPHLEQHEYDEGAHCDADEALAEIAKRDARIAELEAERDEHAAERTRLAMLRGVDQAKIAKLKARVAELEHGLDLHVRAGARAVLRLAKALEVIDEIRSTAFPISATPRDVTIRISRELWERMRGVQ